MNPIKTKKIRETLLTKTFMPTGLIRLLHKHDITTLGAFHDLPDGSIEIKSHQQWDYERCKKAFAEILTGKKSLDSFTRVSDSDQKKMQGGSTINDYLDFDPHEI